MRVHRLVAGILTAACFLLTVDAEAGVTIARRKKFGGRVAVSGKAPNTNFTVWMSSPSDPNDYIDTGFRINTNASGSGSVRIPNSTGGALKTGYNIKIGDSNGPNSQPAKVVTWAGGGSVYNPWNWFASLPSGPSGPHAVVLAQAVVADGMTLIETWDAGTTISLRLAPTEAKWIDMGAVIVPHGDLQASLVGVTDQVVTVQIVNDPTYATIDDLEIQGLGIDVASLGSVGVTLEWSGSSADYLDGVFVDSFAWGVTQSYEFARTSVGGPSYAYCFGDGVDPTVTTPCPCPNHGDPGHGCGNSGNAFGALLNATGTTGPDTVVLTASGEFPSALSIFLQGDANLPAGVVFGDGVRCAGGSLKRLYVKTASGGSVSAPQGGDPSITQQSANLGDPIAPGSIRYYQTYYRDPNPTFCPNPPGNTWNVTNGVVMGW